ncbi:MAG: amino acid adenylation domain-containing protein, partial [Myxococcota bacterium]|nr:amino acid adenylation domain-containing protein [Myxococcota bacterium]
MDNLSATTLVELLEQHASQQPRKVAFEFLENRNKSTKMTYAELAQRARAIAASLRKDLEPGDRALLLYAPGIDYITGFFGCLYAGVIAVPAYPPTSTRTIGRLLSIVEDSGTRVALTTSDIMLRIRLVSLGVKDFRGLKWIATNKVKDKLASQWREPDITHETLAFLQYTSGSTSTPKGVMLTHGNLLANLDMIYDVFDLSQETRAMFWLPPYHDMGLIGAILGSACAGHTCALMSPVSFIKDPIGWLEILSDRRATHSGGPNFAYDLCVRKLSTRKSIDLDLSHWKIALNGAEPIRPETIDRFVQAFAPYGFRKEAFLPAYGLAEATLYVSGTKGLRSRSFQGDSLAQGTPRVMDNADHEARTLIGCGVGAPGLEIAIVDPETREKRRAGEIGEIWVKGNSVAQGYWGRPAQTNETFQARIMEDGSGPFLRTGDLGFFHDEELYITGRIKDLIIVRGRNHYPQDIELTMEQSHQAVRPGGCAAFCFEQDGEERLGVACELQKIHTKTKDATLTDEVISAIEEGIAAQHQVEPQVVILLKAGTIPKTSSGKIQRHACRKLYLEGSKDVLAQRHSTSHATESAPTPEHEEPVDLSSQAALMSHLRGAISTICEIPLEKVQEDKRLTALGLDSLRAVQLLYRLESELEVEIPMTALLEGPTLAELAQMAWRQRSTDRLAPSILENSKEPECYTSEEQELSEGELALWLLQSVSPTSVAYNVTSALRLQGSLDFEALKQALVALVERHEMLRSSFAERDGVPVRVVHPDPRFVLELEDASHDQMALTQERLGQLAHVPFDLSKDPLMRVHVLVHGPEAATVLFVVHHIAVDFWSLRILHAELEAFYAAFAYGAPLPTLAPVLARKDFVDWQRAALGTDRYQEQLRYWCEKLGGEVPVLNIPTDFSRPPIHTYDGSTTPLTIDAEVTAALLRLAEAHDTTLFTVLLCAYQLLLCYRGARQDVVVGTPTLGRPRSELSSCVGYFVNPVAIRTQVEEEQSFNELLCAVKKNVLEAFAHQDVPFARVVEAVAGSRDPGRTPLFQAMLVFQSAPTEKEQELAAFAAGETGAARHFAGMKCDNVTVPRRSAQFELSLMIAQGSQGLVGTAEYNTALFRSETAKELCSHFERLLGAVAVYPDDSAMASARKTDEDLWRVMDHPRLDVSHRDKLEDLSTCVQVIEKQALANPDSTAVEYRDQTMTYRELDRRANRLAHFLVSLGIEPEERVGLCMERSFDLAVGVLAILKAGATYLPLDPKYPIDRISKITADAAARFVLVHDHTHETLSGLPSSIQNTSRLNAELESYPTTKVESKTHIDNLAYCIYTSGSTGQPKGIALPHRCLANLFSWQGSAKPKRTLQYAPLGFDVSVQEILGTWWDGGTLVFPDDEERFDFFALLRRLGKSKIERLYLPFVALDHLSQAARNQELSGLALQEIITAGEQLKSTDAIKELCSRIGCKLENQYGPSETHVVTSHTLCSDPGQWLELPPIGKPIDNTRAYVLSETLNPVPIGVTGELYLSGYNLARCYLNDPAKTAASFVPDPFSPTPGARMYRTGDIVRWSRDGELRFFGRADSQVKIRGYRVELGEIETRLANIEGVKLAAVCARKDESGLNYLVAFVAGHLELLSAEDIKKKLASELPEYMVPSAYVLLDSLPLGATGKVDRKALDKLDAPLSFARAEYVAPRNETETSLAQIWQELLKAERVGIHDDFFNIGGHSLIATKAVSAIRDAFKVNLELRAIFEFPTVVELASKIDALIGKDGQSAGGLWSNDSNLS